MQNEHEQVDFSDACFIGTKPLHTSDWRNHHTNLIGLRSSVGCSQCTDIKTASQLKCSLIIIAHLKQISEEIDVQCMMADGNAY